MTNVTNPAVVSTKERIMSCNIDKLSWDLAINRIAAWAKEGAFRYVCICNVHSVVTAEHDAELRDSINQADMATPDGMPLVWLIRRRGQDDQERINGPDLMLRLCEYAAGHEVTVGLFGGDVRALDLLTSVLVRKYPRLNVTLRLSPPFAGHGDWDNDAYSKQIKASGAQIVFVGLGCPKQEKWMRSMAGRINVVLIGVGAAFDYHAGTKRRPPKWMQNAGLEWLGRWLSEPRRLTERYVTTNSAFLLRHGLELLHLRRK